MAAHVEVTAGIIRCFDGPAEFGKPFAFAIPFVADEGVAILKGVATEQARLLLAPVLRDDVKNALRAHGCTAIRWRRYRRGRSPHDFIIPI